MTTPEIIKALGASELFRDLNAEALADVAAKARARHFSAEDVIIWQGNPSDSVYLLVNGIAAVRRVTGPNEKLTLGYLMSGVSFGEVGILEDRPRSANVEAVSDVTLLAFKRDDFIDLLHTWPVVAVALARMLGGYLVESNRRSVRRGRDSRFVLVLDTFDSPAATGLGLTLAAMLHDKAGGRTGYAEWPGTRELARELGVSGARDVFLHAAGFDVIAPAGTPSSRLDTSVLLETLVSTYDNIVVTLTADAGGAIDADTVLMLDQASQVIVVVPPDAARLADARAMEPALRKYLHRDASLVMVVSGSTPDQAQDGGDVTADFDIPFVDAYPALSALVRGEAAVPDVVRDVAARITDRLDRNNRLAIFIPTTLDVDQQADTTPYVRRALDFLAERFGGATSREAEGVWNSHSAGLVGETVYIVNTFASRGALTEHLDAVVAFVKTLKAELRQEAMALEVNDTLTLI